MIYYAENSEDLMSFGPQINDCFVVKDCNKKRHLYRYYNDDFNRIPIYNDRIAGKDEEQHCFMDLFHDKGVKIINLFGPGGAGKSYLSLGCGLLALENRRFKKIVIIRELIPATRYKAGALPGSYEEKIEPAFAAIEDTFISLAKHSDVLHNDPSIVFENMVRHGSLCLTTLEFFRGRNLEDALLVMDDAQNLTVEDVRLIVTRMGENTSAIFNGDLSQIDHHGKAQPGISYLDKVMAGSKMYGSLTFTHSEYRSEVVKEFLTRERQLKENGHI